MQHWIVTLAIWIFSRMVYNDLPSRLAKASLMYGAILEFCFGGFFGGLWGLDVDYGEQVSRVSAHLSNHQSSVLTFLILSNCLPYLLLLGLLLLLFGFWPHHTACVGS